MTIMSKRRANPGHKLRFMLALKSSNEKEANQTVEGETVSVRNS